MSRIVLTSAFIIHCWECVWFLFWPYITILLHQPATLVLLQVEKILCWTSYLKCRWAFSNLTRFFSSFLFFSPWLSPKTPRHPLCRVVWRQLAMAVRSPEKSRQSRKNFADSRRVDDHIFIKEESDIVIVARDMDAWNLLAKYGGKYNHAKSGTRTLIWNSRCWLDPVDYRLSKKPR